MRRIFWDTMLLIYLLEQHAEYSGTVLASLTASLERGDRLFTSWLAMGEVMAGIERIANPSKVSASKAALDRLPFEKLVFDGACSAVFAHLRAQRVAPPDAIHLSCASSAEMDFFYTNDRTLHRLHVPGIKFIGGLDSGIM